MRFRTKKDIYFRLIMIPKGTIIEANSKAYLIYGAHNMEIANFDEYFEEIVEVEHL
jgi:hypothetical protein